MDATTLPPTPRCPTTCRRLQAMVRQLLAEVARLRAENAELRGKLDAALKHRFGRRCERRSPTPRRADDKPPPPTRRARPRRLARAPRTPRGRPRPDRGGEALPLLRPAARLHRRADGRATRPGAGRVLRAAHRQEELRLPALRPGSRAGRATHPDRRAGAGRADRQGAVRPGSAGPRHHRQVRRPHARCTGWPGNWPARGVDHRALDAGRLAGAGGGLAGAVVPADAPAAVAVAGDPRRRHRGEVARAGGRAHATRRTCGCTSATPTTPTWSSTSRPITRRTGRSASWRATRATSRPTRWPSTRGCTARTRSSTCCCWAHARRKFVAAAEGGRRARPRRRWS